MHGPTDSAGEAPTPPETTVFSAALRPHRSLSRGGTILLLTLLGLISLVSAIPFILMGAWPVGGYFGLDFAVLYLCFRLNNARARAIEEVWLSRIELFVRKVTWRGAVTERRFNPFWVRLKTEEDPDFGMTRLALVQRREEVELGAFLGPEERAEFARAFGAALAGVRR